MSGLARVASIIPFVCMLSIIASGAENTTADKTTDAKADTKPKATSTDSKPKANLTTPTAAKNQTKAAANDTLKTPMKPIAEKPADTAAKPQPLKTAAAPTPPAPKEFTPPPFNGLTHEEDESATLAEVVLLPGQKAPKPATQTPATPTIIKAEPKTASAIQPNESGYATVLSGVMDADLELGPAQSPVLIRGNLVIAEHSTLKLKPGALVHLKADANSAKPAQPDVPDASQAAVVWVWGKLSIEGVTGNPVEIVNQDQNVASLLFYGTETNRLEGARLKGASIVQTSGTCQWVNCEFLNLSAYALGGGIGQFTLCTFKNCGGVFATYNLAAWSLLMRKNIFESCREGLILGSDPGEARLVVEKNHFIGTRGAHIRAMPVANAKGLAEKTSDMEIFIGENWYGTNLPEQIEPRLVDRRIDPAVRARLNTRPPAERPFTNVGAGLSAAVIAATLKEQAPIEAKLLSAHPSRREASKTSAAPQASAEKAAAMNKAVKKPN